MAVELVQYYTEAQGTPVNTDMLIRALKAKGLVCKRTRHSLKKKYEAELAKSSQTINQLSAQA